MADDKAKNATDLGILEPGETISRNDSLGNRENGKKDQVDFFKFTQETEGDINIVVDGLANNQNIDLFLHNANGKRILDKSLNPAGQREFISFQNLEVGKYTVEVRAKAGAKTDYKLSLNAAAEKNEDYDDFPGKPIGVLNELGETFTESNRIGFGNRKNRDKHDYFNFELTERSEVTISLDDLTRDANVELQNFFTDTLLTLNGKENEPELGSLFLDPGQYVLDVKPKGNNQTKYTLSVDAKEDIPDPDNKLPGINLGDLLANEDPLFAVGDIGITEGRRDTKDWYSFQVNEDSDVRVVMDGLDADANFSIWELNANGTKKLRRQGISNNKNRKAEEFNSFLESGNYGIEITTRGSAKTGYYLQVDAQVSDDDFPTPEEANNLGTLTFENKERDNDIGTRDGENFRDTQDWYKFNVDEDGRRVVLNLDGITEDADIELYKNTNKKPIADSSKTEAEEGKEIIQTLDAGDYFLKVVPKGTGNTDYLLEARILEEVDTIQEYEVGNLNALASSTYNAPAGSEIGQNVGDDSRNEKDLYNFTLSAQSSISVNLNQLKDDASLRILDDEGNEVAKSDKPGNNRERIENETLPAGDYTLEVAAVGSDETTYRLKMVANASTETIEEFPKSGGPVFLDAIDEYLERDDIGNSEAGGRNLLDIHNFSLNSQSDFILDLEDLSANINVEVKNSSGDRVLNLGQNPGTIPEKIQGVLEPGNYEVNIFAVDPEPTDYLLVMSADPVTSVDDNDTPDTASALAIPGEVDSVIGEGSDGFDYYKFTLTESSEVSLLLSGLDRNVDLKLEDANGSTIAMSDKSGKNSESISAPLPSGIYYVAVEAKSGRSNYTLVANADALTGDPDGSIATANNFDPLVNPIKDKINDAQGDNSDFYKVSAAGGDRLIATLEGLNGNADLLLLDANNFELQGSRSSSTNGEFINYTFASPGDYYLQVVAGASGVQTNYSLTINI